MSSSGTAASPPVLLGIVDDDPDDLPIFQQELSLVFVILFSNLMHNFFIKSVVRNTSDLIKKLCIKLENKITCY